MMAQSSKASWFTAVTVPVTGEYRSDTDLVDSTSPQVSPASTESPTCGRSANTISPSRSVATDVMPTFTLAPTALSAVVSIHS